MESMVADSLPEILNHHQHMFNVLNERGCFYSGVSTLSGSGDQLFHLFYFKSPESAADGARLIGAYYVKETSEGSIWRVALQVA